MLDSAGVETEPVRDHDLQMQEVLIELRRIEAEFGRRMGELHGEQNRRIDKLADQVESINGHVADVLLELGGAPERRYRDPDRSPIRDRLHAVEDELNLYQEVAQQLVGRADAEQESREKLTAVVDDLKKERERITILNDDRERRQSSWRQRLTVIATAIGIVAACSAMTFAALNYFTGPG